MEQQATRVEVQVDCRRTSRVQGMVVMEQPKRWVTAAKAAQMLSLSHRAIYYLIEDGELPGVRCGRAVRIPVDALEQWIADKEAEAKEKAHTYGSKARAR